MANGQAIFTHRAHDNRAFQIWVRFEETVRAISGFRHVLPSGGRPV
jgi:hypothetical protein